MLGDMFNHGLKSRVDALCARTSQESSPINRDCCNRAASNRKARAEADNKTKPPAHRWGIQTYLSPIPKRTGGQPTWAYLVQRATRTMCDTPTSRNSRRLAVKTGGQVWVYDTLNHQIGGFSQQQGSGSSITFSSQFGTVDLCSLPVLSRHGQPVQASSPPGSPHVSSPITSAGNAPIGGDVFASLERLGELRDKGIVSEEEFNNKKADLLSRV